jgi:hypothetical protein
MDLAFEYDPDKNRQNVERHGIGFEQVRGLWDAPHIIIPARNVRGEARYVLLGRIGKDVYAAVFTWRASAIRLISCHRADARWRRLYERRIHEEKKD